MGNAMRNLKSQPPERTGGRLSHLKWLLVIIALVTIVGADMFTAKGTPLQPDKTWAEVQKRGAIRFGMDAGYMPFEGVTASGEFVGLDVEVAREIARRLGLRAEFVQIGADRLYDTLHAEQCDVLISALAPDDARLKDFSYTASYFDAGLVLVVRSAFAPKLDDLQGRTLAVEVGSEGDARARWLARRTLGLHVLERDTPQEAMQAVAASQADAALTDTTMARQYIAGHSTLRIGQRQTSSHYALAVRIDSHELVRALDRALAQVKADGALEQIVARWLDQ